MKSNISQSNWLKSRTTPDKTLEKFLLFGGGEKRINYFLRVIPTLTHYEFWHTFWHTIWKYIWCVYIYIYSDILSGIYSDILIILSDILSGMRIWHIFWHFIWQSNYYLVYLRRFFVVEVWRGTLWSGARGWGPAGNTLIRSLRWRSGREHSDPELAVEVRLGTLWSRGCCSGPAGNTAI